MAENIPVTSVADYIKKLSNIDYLRYKLFRGENKDYEETKLCSKIGRVNRNNDFRNKHNNNQEFQLFNWFKNEAPKYVEGSSISDIEYLIIGQHYGLKTRLLDFTLNPLIALYFAVKDENKHDGFVYVADEKQELLSSSEITSKSLEEIINDMKRKVLFIAPSNSHKRINSQSGVLALIKEPRTSFDNIEEVFCIPADKKGSIKSMLYKLNIHEESIFQNLDSLSNTLNYRKFD